MVTGKQTETSTKVLNTGILGVSQFKYVGYVKLWALHESSVIKVIHMKFCPINLFYYTKSRLKRFL